MIRKPFLQFYHLGLGHLLGRVGFADQILLRFCDIGQSFVKLSDPLPKVFSGLLVASFGSFMCIRLTCKVLRGRLVTADDISEGLGLAVKPETADILEVLLLLVGKQT
jgi:hypothetical protein